MNRPWPLISAAALLMLAVAPPTTGSAQVHLRDGVTLNSLELAAARDSNDPVTLYDLALGYWSKKRWDDAQRTLERTLAIEPRNAPALLALAYLPYARRPKLWEEEDRNKVPEEWRPALAARDRLLDRAFFIDPLVDLQVVGAVAPKNSLLGHGGREATLEQYAVVGLTNFRNAQYDQAYAWFDRLARAVGGARDPARIPAIVLWYRGLAAAHLNDLPAALTDLKQLYEMSDSLDSPGQAIDPVLATYVYGFLLQRSGRFDEAIQTYRAVLARDLGRWMAHVQLARIYDERGEWVDALSERRLAAEAESDDPSLLLDLGITQFKAGRLDDAAATLVNAHAGLPRNFRVAYYEGVVAQQLGHPAEARAAFDRFLALVPSRFSAEIAEVRDRLRTLP